jgi:hypothetical protein
MQHQRQTLSNSQRWIMATSGLLTILQEGDLDYFGGGIPIKHSLWAQEILKTHGIHTQNDLYRNIDQALGYIPKPLQLSKGLDEDGDILIAFKANALYPPDAGDQTWWQDRYRLGWTLMRTTHLASLAYVACMTSLEEAWGIACLTAEIYQQIFDSWDDVFTAAKRSLTIGDPAANAGYKKLTAENCLWTLSWQTDLKEVTAPFIDRKTFYIKPDRHSISYHKQTFLFQDALAQAEDGDLFILAPGVYQDSWQVSKSIEITSEQGNVICQAPDKAAASILITDAFVRINNIQCISPAGGNRGQVAIACLSGCLLLERSQVSSSGHGISLAKNTKAVLYQCLVDSCALNGVVTEGLLEINSCTLSNIQYHSIHANHQARIYLRYCLFKNSSSHMLSLENESFAYISDSDFENSAQAALVVTANSILEIYRCKLIQAGLIALNAKRCFMLDTTFESAPHYHQAQQQIAVFSQVNELVAVNTQFTKGIQHAVHIDQVVNMRIENSVFLAIQGCGLIISNGIAEGNLSIKNSILYSQGETAVMVNNAKAHFLNCSIEGGKESSFTVTEKSVVDLRSCQFKKTETVALLIRNHASCVINNCIFTNIHSAIRLINAWAQLHLCQFKEVKNNGVEVKGESNLGLTECHFEKIGKLSLKIQGASFVTAKDLKITMSNMDVILVEDKAYLTLTSAEFDESKQISIHINNATLFYSHCDAIAQKQIEIKNMRDANNRTASEMWLLGLAAVVTQMESNNIWNHKEIGGFNWSEKSKSWAVWVVDHLYEIKNRDDLLEWVDSLKNDGFTQAMQDNLANLPNDPSRDNYQMRFLRDHADEIRRGVIMSWDYARLATITGWSALGGHISESEYWEIMIPVARYVQKNCSSWKEYADGYLLGQQYWSEGVPHEPTIKAINELFTNPNSPWLQYAWNTSLDDLDSVATSSTNSLQNEPEIFPNQPVSRLSEYVNLVRMAQSGQIMQAMSSANLDMTSYGQVMQRWGQKIASDPSLAMKFSQMLYQS